MKHRALDAWMISDRVTALLIAGVPVEVWELPIPGFSRKSIRNIAAHLHNCRCGWMKSLAIGTGIPIPERIDPKDVSIESVVAALGESGPAIAKMIEAGISNGGSFPGVSEKYIFGAMPVDAVLFADYAIAHEAHHRGQIVIAARVLGHPLPKEIIAGLWQWSSRLKEAKA